MSMQNAWTGRIESISQEGLGIGTITAFEDGKRLRRPIFIPFSVPGDEIEAKITEQKRKYSFGEILRVIDPSPQRVATSCPHYTVCGGCNLQHIAYDEQLRQKGLQVDFLLTRKGIVLPHPVKVLPSKQRHNYRARAKIAIQFTGSRPNAGFRKFHAHDIVPVKTCMIVAEEIVQLITLLNKSETRLGGKGTFTHEIIVVVGEHRKLGILVPLDAIPPESRKTMKDYFEDIYSRNRRLIGNLFFEEDRKTKTSGQVQEHITYKAAGCTYSFLPETFIQSNVATDETLIMTVRDFLLRGIDPKDKTVLDLYAGLGNITLPLAKLAHHVVAVEGHESSVLLGRINAYQNGIENVTNIHRSTEKYLHEYQKVPPGKKEEYPKSDLIVLDPPRTGCTPEVIQSLLSIGIPRMVYVSCNPVTLAADLAQLTKQYDVTDITGIDMFPDISHVETVVQLTKRS
jgi:23S rRNA (uracil1939-C5)-methyltransferase